MPKWLQDEAKAEWRRLAPRLEALGVLTVIDGPAFELLVQVYARWRWAEEELSRDPGDWRLAIQCDRCANLLRVQLAEFGLTPSSRSKVQITQPAPDDDLSEILS